MQLLLEERCQGGYDDEHWTASQSPMQTQCATPQGVSHPASLLLEIRPAYGSHRADPGSAPSMLASAAPGTVVGVRTHANAHSADVVP